MGSIFPIATQNKKLNTLDIRLSNNPFPGMGMLNLPLFFFSWGVFSNNSSFSFLPALSESFLCFSACFFLFLYCSPKRFSILITFSLIVNKLPSAPLVEDDTSGEDGGEPKFIDLLTGTKAEDFLYPTLGLSCRFTIELLFRSFALPESIFLAAPLAAPLAPWTTSCLPNPESNAGNAIYFIRMQKYLSCP